MNGALHRGVIPGLLTGTVASLVFILGLAYNLGLAEAQITSMSTQMSNNTAEIAALQQDWATQQNQMDEKLAQIQQTLADMRAQREAGTPHPMAFHEEKL